MSANQVMLVNIWLPKSILTNLGFVHKSLFVQCQLMALCVTDTLNFLSALFATFEPLPLFSIRSLGIDLRFTLNSRIYDIMRVL